MHDARQAVGGRRQRPLQLLAGVAFVSIAGLVEMAADGLQSLQRLGPFLLPLPGIALVFLGAVDHQGAHCEGPVALLAPHSQGRVEAAILAVGLFWLRY